MKISGKEIKEMTNKQIIHWLHKTMQSVTGYQKHSNGLINNRRAFDLVDRYRELKEEAKERAGGKIWNFYCNKYGMDKSHDEYDNFA